MEVHGSETPSIRPHTRAPLRRTDASARLVSNDGDRGSETSSAPCRRPAPLPCCRPDPDLHLNHIHSAHMQTPSSDGPTRLLVSNDGDERMTVPAYYMCVRECVTDAPDAHVRG